MQAVITRTSKKDLNFSTAKRMLVRVMKLLSVYPAKLQQFHEPKQKDGLWTWVLVPNANDAKKHIPLYFIVNQDTLECTLSVTRKTRDEILRWDVKLPTDLLEVKAEEILEALGF
jgi:hypothetical protein